MLIIKWGYCSDGIYTNLLCSLCQSNSTLRIYATDMRNENLSPERISNSPRELENCYTLFICHQRPGSIRSGQEESVHSMFEHPSHMPFSLGHINGSILCKKRDVWY